MNPGIPHGRAAQRLAPGTVYRASVDAHAACPCCQRRGHWDSCPKRRPWVVYAADGPLVFAVPLSSQERKRRLQTQAAWIVRGWLRLPSWAACRERTVCLPAWAVLRLGQVLAARFSEEGVAAVVAEVRACGGLLPAALMDPERKEGAA